MTDAGTDTLVDGRYRIVSRLGSGGMADVFCAEDTQLGRSVALKVLHRRFTEDPRFVERFRREASSAAALQHPNVVGVYDRGEHDGTYYIAMEYLEGRTLKQVIADDAPLAQERAIDLGIQILAAAAFAHGRGMVHRDFKPQNVIVDENDSLKVTDFGIARAGESEMTETGSILGTAQYLSPEQAQGQTVGPSSDVYSIGVILYELVAGRLPFEARSAVAIAVQHLNQPPPPLSQLRPDVHPALEAAILRALAKDPADRWQSAEDFLAALQGARAAIAMGDEGQATAVWAPLVAEGPEPEQVRGRRWPLVVALVLLAAAAAAAYLLFFATPKVTVPNVVGSPLVQAQPELLQTGLPSRIEKERDEAPVNEVIAQEPPAGSEIAEGTVVTLTVSSGPGTATVPDVEGLEKAKAIGRLRRFQVETQEETSQTIEAGLAIRSVPVAGTRRPRGSSVTLYISTGPRIVRAPRVVGLDVDEARSDLEAEGFEVTVQEQDSDLPRDEVIAQTPEPGAEVEKGSTATLTVSNGANQPVEVPNVGGLDEGRAVGRLRSAGFQVRVREERVRDAGEDGVVLSQSPEAGAEVPRGETVDLYVGVFEAGAESDGTR